MIRVIAYQPTKGTPLEDYTDYPIGMELSTYDVEQTMKKGHFPPGIVLRGEMAGKVSKPQVVKGHYHSEQRIEEL